MPTATKAPARLKLKASGAAARRRQSPANELRDLRRRHSLSQALLARLLDVSLRTLSGAESGAAASAAIPPRMRRSLTQVARLCAALTEAMRPAFVGQWLDRPNELLGCLKPVEAIERGQLDLVWQVAEGLRSGSHL